MLHDTFPHTFSNAYVPVAAQEGDTVFRFDAKGVYLTDGRFPRFEEYPPEAELQFLFTFDGRAVHICLSDCIPSGAKSAPLRVIRALPPHEAFLGGVAQHLWAWRQATRFCGCCGRQMVHSATERAMVCPECGNTVYPRISPAVIVLITCGDKLFLARGAHYAGTFYSLVAGYVEAGESFEQAVAREVLEEVGLTVQNIRYWGNQPWPFSQSHMIGFTAEADDTQPIRLQPEEILDAGWYTLSTLPETAGGISIAGAMIAQWKAERDGGNGGNEGDGRDALL